MLSTFKWLFGMGEKKPEIYDRQEEQLEESYQNSRLISIADSVRDSIVDGIDFTLYTKPLLVNEDTKPNIMIVDDIPDTRFIYHIDFKKIKRDKGLDVYKDFGVVECFSEDAGFMAFDYARRAEHIDYAILDITLENNIKLDTGEFLQIDGIDIAIELRKHNPNIKILFSTAHTMNRRNTLMDYYFTKFANYTDGEDLMDYYLNKNGDRATAIYNLLKPEQDNVQS